LTLPFTKILKTDGLLNHSKIHQIPTPVSSKLPLQKYNGHLLITNPSLLEKNASITTSCNTDIPTKCSIKSTLIESKSAQQKPKSKITCKKNDNNQETASALVVKENDVTAPMNLAHQNWKFVEQLLKQTKGKKIFCYKFNLKNFKQQGRHGFY